MKNTLIATCLLLFLGILACTNESANTDNTNNTATNAPVQNPDAPQGEPKTDAPAAPINPQRFEESIKTFEAQDQKYGIEAGKILFVGSSSIRMWESLEKDMAPHKVINRGFGGSTIPEVLQYFTRVVEPYNPKAIVLYCGENDISEGAAPEEVFQTFVAFSQAVKFKFPKAKLAYISMKPSVARWDLWPKYQEGNALIKNFIQSDPQMTYLESADSMLDENGEVKKDIFIADGLHMNAKGYRGWAKMVKPVIENWKE